MMSPAQQLPGAPAELDDACGNAMNLQLTGRADLAEQIYAAILHAAPTHAVANHCMGMLNVQLQRPANGLPYLRAALNADPEVPDYWLGYVEALLQAGEIEGAIETLTLARQHGLAGAAADDLERRLKARHPHPAVAEPRSNPLPPFKRSRAARRREARLTGPQDAALLALVEQRRFDEARAQAAAMTAEFPLHGLGWKILGAMHWVAGNSEDALAAMRTSALLMPTDAETHSNLGMILAKSAQFEEAAVYLDKAIEIDPKFAAARYRQGMSSILQGRYSEAEAILRSAIALRSGSLTADDILGRSNLLYVLCYNPQIDADALFNEHRRVGEELEAGMRAHRPRHRNIPDPDRRLHVGLVSGDLRNHAVATFFEPVLAHLGRRGNFELHAYSNCALEDDVTTRLRGYVHHWNPIANFTDEKLEQKIIDDRIDILVDLSGHTGMNRLRTFARKPAPIQASWIGYPGTTGLTAMDYYLADKYWLPPGQFDSQFTEKLVYLPANVPFQPYAAAPPVNPLPALASGAVTFGSFNRLGKINGATIGVWSQLLHAVPESTLLVGGLPVNGSPSWLVEQFAALGIAAERLHLHPRGNMDAYLALHHQVDICLDTFPYTGGTTTNHALWMGVPTLTIAGQTPAARQGAAVLGLVGLDGFIAADAADFIAKGIQWTTRLAALADVRAGLRERCRGSLPHQPEVVVAGLECALRHMWERWCAGLPAESFHSTATAGGQNVDNRPLDTVDLRYS
jgi:predicted O-linked N-acetylglucosamine transferase (SPINDLY family)